ncbi:MAG: ABC transporter ATP-binding protein [Candidatus Hinthialibacter antarcticus]|nr:ABC transporter ATP-binding protein [Candidatus Hinthialibacter antarcticus]
MREETISGKAYDARLMQRLYPYIAPYWKYIVWAFLALTISTSIELASLYLYKSVIDQFIQNEETRGLAMLCGIYILLLLAGFLFQYTQFYLVNLMSQKSMYDLRLHLFRHLESRSLAFFNNRPVGYLMTRLTSDIEAMDSMFANCIVFTFSDVLYIIGLLVVMFSLSPSLTFVVLLVMPVIVWASIKFKNEVRDSYREVRRVLSEINGFLQENISGMETVQIFGRQKEHLGYYSNLTDEYRKANVRSIYNYAVFYPTVEFLGAVTTVLLLWFGGGFILIENPAFVGTLVAFIISSQKFFQPIRDLADKFNILQTGMTAAERVFKLMDIDEVVSEPEQPVQQEIKGEVEFRNVSFAYKEGEWILKNVSFKAPIGKRVAIVGPTGSGKSTIINLIFRFYDVQEGEVLIDGVNVKEYDLSYLREQIGLVLQDFFLFSGDIQGNISLGRPDVTPERIEHAAKIVQADRFIEKMADGYGSEVKERGATLSVGQRQLLSFARALVSNPQILILDEATSSVDTETEFLIQEAIERLIEGRTSLVIAHRLSTIQQADEILVLHRGEIVERGAHQELLARKGMYYRLYQLQYKNQSLETAVNE